MKSVVTVGCLFLLLANAASADSVSAYRNKDDAWFKSAEGRRIIDNIITHQRNSGGWKKAYDAEKPDTNKAKKPDRVRPRGRRRKKRLAKSRVDEQEADTRRRQARRAGKQPRSFSDRACGSTRRRSDDCATKATNLPGEISPRA